MFKTFKEFTGTFMLKAVRYGLFFSAFTPLIIFRTFWSPTNFGKVIIFRILIEVIFAFWIILAVENSRYRPKLNFVGWAFLFFVLSYLISSLAGINPSQSFWGGFERMGGAFNLIHYFIFFVILTSVFKFKNDWLVFLNLILIAGIFSILYGFFQLGHWKFILGALTEGSRERIFGSIGNPAMFGGYLLFVVYLSLFLLLGRVYEKVKLSAKIFYSVTILLSVVAIFMTAVRGAVFALFISGAGLLLWYLFFTPTPNLVWGFIFRRADAKIRIKSFLPAILISFLLLFLFFNYSGVKSSKRFERIFHVSLNEITVRQRILVWKEALNGFRQKPFLGWGPENFTVIHERYFEPKSFYGPGGSIFDRPHNIFLEVLSTQGLIGFFAYAILWLSIFAAIKKRYKNFPLAAAILFFLSFAYLIQGFFFFDSFSVLFMLSSILAMVSSGLIFGNGSGGGPRDAGETPAKHKWIILFAGVFTLMGLAIYYLSILPLLANNLSAKAAINLSNNNYELGFEQWKHSLSYDLIGSYATDMRLNVEPVYMNALYKSGKNISKEKIEEDLDYLVGEFQKGLEKNPHLVENYIALDALYVSYANFVDREKLNDSIEVLKKALIFAPSMINTWHELGNVQNIKGDYEDAIKSLTVAYNLNTNYLPSEFMLAKSYILVNKSEGFELGIDAFTRGYENLDDLFWLGSNLKRSGKINDLIGLLKSLSKKDPNYLVYLAIAYKDADRISEAKSAADELLNYEDNHPGIVLDNNNYNILADLYKYFGDIKKRTRAFEKSGALAPF